MKKIRLLGKTVLGGGFMITLGLGGCEKAPVFSGTDAAGDRAVDGSQSGGGGSGAMTGSGGLSIGQGGSSGGTGAMGGADSCAESSESADLVPANLLFVVDKSGSMNCNPPPIDPTCPEPRKVDEMERSKWEITQEALTGEGGALETLAGQAGVSAGLIAFPLDNNCQVPDAGEVTVAIEPLSQGHLANLQEGLSLSADGQTPLAGAAIRGLEALRRGIHSGDLDGDNYLVVMTDGAETCQTEALGDLVRFVEEAREFYGIRTYAIGAPGSEASRSLLSELAVIGGTRRSTDCSLDPDDASESCHIDLTESQSFASDLGSEFKGITEDTARTCEFDVPQNAFVDRSKVNVEFTSRGNQKELIVQDPLEDGKAQCEDAQGWQFSPGGSQIVLCGEVCDAVLSDPDASVRVVFGCRETVVR